MKETKVKIKYLKELTKLEKFKIVHDTLKDPASEIENLLIGDLVNQL